MKNKNIFRRTKKLRDGRFIYEMIGLRDKVVGTLEFSEAHNCFIFYAKYDSFHPPESLRLIATELERLSKS